MHRTVIHYWRDLNVANQLQRKSFLSGFECRVILYTVGTESRKALSVNFAYPLYYQYWRYLNIANQLPRKSFLSGFKR